MLKNFVRIGSIGAALLIAAGCGGGSTGPSNSTNGTGTGTGGGGGYGDPGTGNDVCPAGTFCLRDATFDPTNLTVTVNAAVPFQNNSGVTHHVVFDAPASAKAVGTGNSGDIGDISSGAVQRTWSVAGKYNFHCTIHAGMAGSVTVQ